MPTKKTEKQKLANAMAALKAASSAGPSNYAKAMKIKVLKERVVKAKLASAAANKALVKSSKRSLLGRAASSINKALDSGRTKQIETANTGVKSDRQKSEERKSSGKK